MVSPARFPVNSPHRFDGVLKAYRRSASYAFEFFLCMNADETPPNPELPASGEKTTRGELPQRHSGPRDWRDRGHGSLPGSARVWTPRLVLVVATVAAIAAVAGFAITPLFGWQTACIAILYDDYAADVLSPVPYATEDFERLADTLSGRASVATDRGLMRFTDLETSSAMRERLAVRVGDLRVRSKDTLFAYVRGQSLVVPPAIDEAGRIQDDPLNGVPCFLAADLALRGTRPAGLFSCRQVVESLAAAINRTTLIALDLGNLQWDPRLGVLCSLVPERLDTTFSQPSDRAIGDTWIMSSHDTLEFSNVSPGDKRTLFALALQSGLNGAADAAGWGDGDGVIELDELARFVTSATMEWSRTVSGGRHIQRPVVWHLGRGRVELADLPPDISIIRTPSRPLFGGTSALSRLFGRSEAAPAREPSAPTPSSTAADQPPSGTAGVGDPKPAAVASLNDDPGRAGPPTNPSQPELSDPAAVKDPGDEAVATADARPPSPAAPSADGKAGMESAPDARSDTPGPGTLADSSPSPQDAAPNTAASLAKPPDDPWKLLRDQTARGVGGMPSLVDIAPHIWRCAASRLAREQVGLWVQDSHSPACSDWLRGFRLGMTRLSIPRGTPSQVAPTVAELPVVDLIRAARSTAETSGVVTSWTEAPPAERTLAATRNDAFELASSLLTMGGRLSGGVAPVAFPLRSVEAAIEQIARASSLISAAAAESSDTDLSDTIGEATQTSSIMLATLHEVVKQTTTTLLGSAGQPGSAPFHELRIVLESPLLTGEERVRLGAQFEKTFQAQPLQPPQRTVSQPLARRPLSRALDQNSRRNIAALVNAFANVYAAGGVAAGANRDEASALLPINTRIGHVRKATIDLFADERPEAATDTILHVSGCLSRLLADAAAVGSGLESPRDGSDEMAADQWAGVLRILDPRDAALIRDTLLARLPRATDEQNLLSLTYAENGRPQRGAPVRMVVRQGAGRLDPAAAEAVFDFDPALIRLATVDGTPVNSRSPMPARALGWRGGVAEILATPIAASAADDGPLRADVRLVLRQGRFRESAIGRVPLPVNRDLVLVARGSGLTLTTPAAADGWSRAFRTGDSSSESTLPLAALPSGATSWDLGIHNLAGRARTVGVEIYSVASGPAPGDRDTQWRIAADKLRAGTWADQPFLVATKVPLPKDNRVASLPLVPPEKAQVDEKAPEPMPDTAVADNGQTPTLELPAPDGAKGDRPVGPDLAVVIRESDREGTDNLFVSRIRLGVLHPRAFVSAEARYDEQRRQISVALAPRLDGESTDLPPGRIEARLRPLGRDAGAASRPGAGVPLGVPAVVARKPTATLSRGGSDVAIASWNGPDQGTAYLTLDINGYPRAFTFAVDCSPAMAGRPQGPHQDWRSIAIEQPAAARSLIRAPAPAIPMRLAADAPPDAFGGSGMESGTVAIVLRQIGAGLAGSEPERVAWIAASDRDIRFTANPGGPGLGVTATVDDWQIDASGEGFANVDVQAEARLLTTQPTKISSDSRLFVFDGTPPVVDAPPAMAGVVGRPLIIPLRVSDDVSDGFFIPPDRIRPGVSGIKRVEWAIDLAGTGEPKEWQPATQTQGVNYELRVDTAKLPLGIQLPLLVRATDKVDLSAPPSRIWLDIAPQPASQKNDLAGRVTLNGRGEAGVTVTMTGPSGERTVRSGANGAFRFTDLEPGEYRLLAGGAVRNTTRRAEPLTVTIPAAPAPSPSVTIELR